MLINNISVNTRNINLKRNQEKSNYASDVTFQGEKGNISPKAAALLALMTMTTLPMSGCQTDAVKPTVPVEPNAGEYAEVGGAETLDELGNKLDLVDIGFVSMPVSEFYMTNKGESVIFHPKADLPRNEEGAVIVTIVPEGVSDSSVEGTCLDEIIYNVYSSEIEKFDPSIRSNIMTKVVDEIIQANPELAAYIKAELGDNIYDYDDILSLDLYAGTSSKDQTLDTRLLIMPETIFYEVQGIQNPDEEFCYSTDTYSPSFESASLIKDSDDLLDGEFASISDMIYSAYGEDISDEAYRDILYSIVNSPLNADKFESTLGKMNFNEILYTKSIHDLNRTLEENMSDVIFDIQLPAVTTQRTQSHSAILTDGCSNEIISQISPARTASEKNDLRIVVNDKVGEMKDGDVFKLIDVLQYYASPDGNGRFAYVHEGNLELNYDANYAEQFANQILKQVVHANLDIFLAPYEDESGFHNYGVFDLAPGADIEGKSIEQMVIDGSLVINEGRMMNYSFVDANGKSILPDGETLELPQFNYNISVCEKKPACEVEKPTEPTKPTRQTEPTTPTETEPTTPTETEPTTPTETEPTTPTETEPTTPTETEPTTPTETEPTCDPEPTEPTVPEEDPTLPTDTVPTTPTETEPTTPTDTQPTEPEIEIPTQPSATDTPPVEPTSEPDLPSNPTGEDVEPVDPTQTPTETPTQEPTGVPTETPTEVPTETPTETPTEVPTECPDDPSDEPIVDESTPTIPGGEDVEPETPTEAPTEAPTQEPTTAPTEAPTEAPTQAPTCDDVPSDEPVVDENVPEISEGEDDKVSDPTEPTIATEPTVSLDPPTTETVPTTPADIETQPSNPANEPSQAPEPTQDSSCGDVPADEEIFEEEAPAPFTLSASNTATNAYSATVTANASTTSDTYKAPDSVTAKLASFFIRNNKTQPKEGIYFNV